MKVFWMIVSVTVFFMVITDLIKVFYLQIPVGRFDAAMDLVFTSMWFLYSFIYRYWEER